MSRTTPARRRPVALEPLEVRRLMSVAVAPLFFPTPVGTVLHYQVSQGGTVVGTATRAVIGPATFNGVDCTEIDEVMTASDHSVVETDREYFRITADGVAEYGSNDTETDATGAVVNSNVTTYAPPLTKLPATVTAGVTVSNSATRTDVYTPTGGGQGSSDGGTTGGGGNTGGGTTTGGGSGTTDGAGNPTPTGTTAGGGTGDGKGNKGDPGGSGNGSSDNGGTRTVTETDAFTLVSETPQSVVVPAGTFAAYQIDEDDLTPDGDGSPSNDGIRFWVSADVGIVKAESVKDGGYSEVLTSVDGPVTVTPTPTPTTTPVLTPVAGPSTVPTNVVSGAKTKASVAITISNDGAKASRGPTTVKLYATTTGVIDADSIVVGSVTKRLSLASGSDATLSVPVKKLDLPPGVYTLLARTTTPGGTTTDATDGPTVTVAAPYVALAATVSTPAAATVGRSGFVTLTLTNAGTADANGPATISITAVAADGTTVAVTSVVRPVKVKAGGRAVVLKLKVKVPTTLAAGTYTATALVTVGANSATATAPAPIVIS